MSRFTSLSFVPLATILALFSVGCGSSDVAQTSPPANPASKQTPAATDQLAATDEPGPTDVVSQFLDRVRRGGSDSGAKELMTQKAQQELARIGQEMKPIGTPDAKYQVTRAVDIPDEENMKWVASIWSEANELGQTANFQVVWTVRKEAEGWRICGMAMEIDPNTAPLEIDFENGDQLAAVLYEETSQPEATVAANPNTQVSPAQDPNAPPVPNTVTNPPTPGSSFGSPNVGGAVPAGPTGTANPAGNSPQSFALPPSFQQ